MNPTREHRHILNRIIHTQTYEPAEQQTLVEMFHQHPVTAHGPSDVVLTDGGRILISHNTRRVIQVRWRTRGAHDLTTRPATMPRFPILLTSSVHSKGVPCDV